MNRDDKDFTIVPGIGPEQDSRKDHDYRGRILRTTVTAKLPTLRERAYAFNDLPLEKRLYFIDGLIAYGSYCNSDREKIGDLDIGILYSQHGKELNPEFHPEEAEAPGIQSSRLFFHEAKNDPNAYEYTENELKDMAWHLRDASKPFYYAQNKMMDFLKKGDGTGARLTFLEIHEMVEAIQIGKECGEIPYMFYGNFMWIARPNESRCQEIDKMVAAWRADSTLKAPNHEHGGTALHIAIKQELERSGKPYGHSNQFGNFLKQRMEQEGIDKKQLAELVETTPATINSWLIGKTTPGYFNQMRLYDVLNMRTYGIETINRLIKEQEDEKNQNEIKIQNAMFGIED